MFLVHAVGWSWIQSCGVYYDPYYDLCFFTAGSFDNQPLPQAADPRGRIAIELEVPLPGAPSSR